MDSAAYVMDKIAEDMRRELPVADRTYHLRTYKQVFLGCDAVQWLVQNGHADDRNEAIRIGNILMGKNIFRHVTGEHPLEDKKLFYRFTAFQSSSPSSRDMLTTRQALTELTLKLDVADARIAEMEKKMVDAEARFQHLYGTLLNASDVRIDFFTIAGGSALVLSLFMAGSTTIVGSILYLSFLASILYSIFNRVRSLRDGLANVQHETVVKDERKSDFQYVGKPGALVFQESPVHARAVFRSSSVTIPINAAEPVPFTTETFEGRIILRMKGEEGVFPATNYFTAGRRRRMACFVQGRFRREVPASSLLTGQRFLSRLGEIPGKFILQSVFALVKKISPSLNADIFASQPYAYSSLLATAQTVHVATSQAEAPDLGRAGEDPSCEAELERTLSLFPQMAPMTAGQRKAFLNTAEGARALQNKVFGSDHVYTFGFWSHAISADRDVFGVSVGPFHFDLSAITAGQPIRILGLTADRGREEALWNVELWHRTFVESK